MNTAWGISTELKSKILFNPIIKCTIIFCSLKPVFTLLKHWSLKNIYYLNKIHIQDLTYSVQWLRQLLSSGMWFCVFFSPEDGGSRFVHTSSNFPPDHTMSDQSTQYSSRVIMHWNADYESENFTLETGVHTLLSKDYPSVKTSIFITSTQLAKTKSNNGHTLFFQNQIRHLSQQYTTCLIPTKK